MLLFRHALAQYCFVSYRDHLIQPAAPSRNDNEWYTALSHLLSDEHLRRRMGAADHKNAVEHYSVAAQAQKLADALRAAIHK